MKSTLLTLSVLSVFFFVFAPFAQASSLGELVNTELDIVQAGVTGSTTSPDAENIVIDIIQIALSFLGLIFVVLIIWSGYQWMTAGGNATAIETAKKRLTNAVIGLLIILAAYTITEFIIIQIHNSVR